tara:strand:+ start:219 stop:410 length:192 start_codon:yes stop_codon:yes gene_type:complete
MKRFRITNKKIQYMDRYGERKFDSITVTIHKPPYTDEIILNKTGWDKKDVTIKDVTPKFMGEE